MDDSERYAKRQTSANKSANIGKRSDEVKNKNGWMIEIDAYRYEFCKVAHYDCYDP